MSNEFINKFIQINNENEMEKALLIMHFLKLSVDNCFQYQWTYPCCLYRFNSLVSQTKLSKDELKLYDLTEILLEEFLNY